MLQGSPNNPQEEKAFSGAPECPIMEKSLLVHSIQSQTRAKCSQIMIPDDAIWSRETNQLSLCPNPIPLNYE